MIACTVWKLFNRYLSFSLRIDSDIYIAIMTITKQYKNESKYKVTLFLKWHYNNSNNISKTVSYWNLSRKMKSEGLGNNLWNEVFFQICSLCAFGNSLCAPRVFITALKLLQLLPILPTPNVYLFVYLSICRIVFFVNFSIYLSLVQLLCYLCLFICLSLSLFTCLSISLLCVCNLYIYLSIYLSFYLCLVQDAFQAISVSIYLPAYLSSSMW